MIRLAGSRLNQDTRPEVTDALTRRVIHTVPVAEKRKEAARQAINGRELEKVPEALLRFLARVVKYATAKQREVLDLHLFKGLTMRETAQVLGITERAASLRQQAFFDGIGPRRHKSPRRARRRTKGNQTGKEKKASPGVTGG